MDSIEVLKVDGGKLAIRVGGVKRASDATKGRRDEVYQDGYGGTIDVPREDSKAVRWWTLTKYQKFIELARRYDGEYRTMVTVTFDELAPMSPDKLTAGFGRFKRMLSDVCATEGFVGGLEFGETGKQISPHYHILTSKIFSSKERQRLRKHLAKKMIYNVHFRDTTKESKVEYVLKTNKGKVDMKPLDGSTAVGWEGIKLPMYISNKALRDRQTKGETIKIDKDVLDLLGLGGYNHIYLKRIPLLDDHKDTNHITMEKVSAFNSNDYYKCFKIAKQALRGGSDGSLWKSKNDMIHNIIYSITKRLLLTEKSVAESDHNHFERVCIEELKNIPLPTAIDEHQMSADDFMELKV